jgi:hypothetical protein
VSTIHFIPLCDALVNRVFSRVLFRKRVCSNHLYHYTTKDGFQGILGDNRIRATSAASSKDREEIAYGCELFAHLIDAKIRSKAPSAFTEQILNELKDQPKDQIPKTFLASFCEQDDCPTLWSYYGGYCLRFPVNPDCGISLLAPQAFAAEMVPAIYDRSEQETALVSLLDFLIETIEDQSLIRVREPAPELARFVAFTVSQFALPFIVPLKNRRFEHEREWRMVIRPSHKRFSSDSTEGDRNCECFIKTNWSKPFIELCGPTPVDSRAPAILYVPKLPLDAVRIGPCDKSATALKLSRQLLDHHGLQSAAVLESEIPTLLDCH